jgi:hypothetical protein
MLTCKLDGAEFEDHDKAMQHICDAHSDLITEELQEFTREAEEVVFEINIKES